MNDVEEHIKDWIKNISTIRPELSNFSVCPFSSTATYKVIYSNIDDIMPVNGFDVVIFVVEDYLDVNAIQFWCDFYDKKYPDYIFLEDCAYTDFHINGIKTNNGRYNLVLCQKRKKLQESRKILSKSGYYDHWDDEMVSEILGEDQNIVKKTG